MLLHFLLQLDCVLNLANVLLKNGVNSLAHFVTFILQLVIYKNLIMQEKFTLMPILEVDHILFKI